LLEDRVVTTDLLRQETQLSSCDRGIWLPDGVFELLGDTAFHVVLPAGRVTGPTVDRLFVELVIDTPEGTTRVDAMAEDEWFEELPTAHAVLSNFCLFLPDAARTVIDGLNDRCDG
jgi:hypothetical protein